MDFTKKPENTQGRSQFLKSGTSESEGESDEWSSSGDEDDESDRDGAGGIRAAGPSIFLKRYLIFKYTIRLCIVVYLLLILISYFLYVISDKAIFITIIIRIN